ncbi:ABC transporter permease [Nonomuraea muscovyensis]|uniref:ABC-2 type transport system permease protein n=1 Tax=Nonomuraea muscovyensis TaxID=1124761 RepID=A0A7X0CA27_9ACTN|nr:ABC transporter permease subunit [Nonomuraea muscovyensis]MBB6350431.1 ABC-2 type transport system permease protein [Nonomuraea muscovyensis]
MNTVVAGITYRALLGRRRIVLLLLLPLGLLGLAVLLRLTGNADQRYATMLMNNFALGTMLPLLGLIVGTGVIAPEIDDGTVIHLMSKPISRPVIAQTKFAVAASLLVLFAAVPTYLAAWLLVRNEDGIALGFAVGSLVAGIAYAAVFLLLGVVTRHAVTIGVVYALVWESLVGNLVPGAQKFSIQQWGRTIADQISTSPYLEAQITLGFAAPALVIATVVAVVWAGLRLRVFALTGDE